MKKLEEIEETINRHRGELKKRFKVKSIAIFGSYVRGEQSPESDIDLLVAFDGPVSLLHIVSLENYISDILKIKADVVPVKNIREEIKEDILKESISI